MEQIITKDNFDEIVTNADKPVLLDFWATWCGPCRMIAPVIEEIADEHPEIVVGKVTVDEQPELAERFGIQYIPTLIVLRDGRIAEKKSGYMDKVSVMRMVEGV